jgi:hypothetical protein
MALWSESIRRPVLESGNITVVSMGVRPARFVFSSPQMLKEGALIYVRIPDGYNGYTARERYTIHFGSGTQWQAHQKVGAAGTWTWITSDRTNSRLRGDVEGCQYVPGAKHFLYVSPVDPNGNPDWYTYVDTLYPENGFHPYTRDQWTGEMWLTKEDGPRTIGALVRDPAGRLSDLDLLPPVLLR